MNIGPKKALAIHDLSGVGRCALSVIFPTLSAMGVQVCAVPTAILSAHTAFSDVAFYDLTEYMKEALSHYKNLDIDFDCIYSGFLGSEAQIDICKEYFSTFPNTIKIVDPVMGDHGKPYKTYTPTLIKRMSELVSEADIITPNLTEVSMLLNEPYREMVSRQDAKQMLVKLAKKGPSMVVITGVPLQTGEMANLAYDRDNDAFWEVICNYVPVSYPGTGDIFASVLVGSILTGDSLPMAVERATRFLELAINTTYGYKTDKRYGVMLEMALPSLIKKELQNSYHSF